MLQVHHSTPDSQEMTNIMQRMALPDCNPSIDDVVISYSTQEAKLLPVQLTDNYSSVSSLLCISFSYFSLVFKRASNTWSSLVNIPREFFRPPTTNPLI